MRISDSHPQHPLTPIARTRHIPDATGTAPAGNGYGEVEDFSSLSLPSMLALTAPEHPQRQAFLTAMSQSLRAGLLASDPDQVAGSLMARGFGSRAD